MICNLAKVSAGKHYSSVGSNLVVLFPNLILSPNAMYTLMFIFVMKLSVSTTIKTTARYPDVIKIELWLTLGPGLGEMPRPGGKCTDGMFCPGKK